MMDNVGLDRQLRAPYMANLDDLRADIQRQRTSLVERETRLKEQIAGLQAELAKVEAVLRNFDVVYAPFLTTGSPIIEGDSPKMTIKEGVLKVLEKVAPRGLSATSILERLSVDLDMHYPRTSLSPQLSRLKSEGKIRLEGGVWFLNTNRNGSGAEAPEPPQ